MNIETTNFEHEHESSEIKNSLGDDYVYHNITVHNEMKINNETVAIYYQAGHTYYHGSHGSPSNELSFYKSNNNQIDRLLNDLRASDFEDESCAEYIEELISKFNDKFDIKSKADLIEVYETLNDNLSAAEQYRLHEMELSSDIKDYDLSEFEDGFKYCG